MQTISSAIILAAGFGQRLRPLTEIFPKPLMPVGSQTSLRRIVSQLQTVGCQQFYFNTYHLADSMETAIQNLPIASKIVRESVLRGTGGGLANFAESLGDQPFLLHNCDIYSEEPLQNLRDFHDQQQALCTLMTVDYPPINSLQCQHNTVEHFTRLQAGNATYAGIAVFSPRIWQYVPSTTRFSLVSVWEAAQQAGETLATYHSQAYWNDFGTPQRYWDLHQHLAASKPSFVADSSRITNSLLLGFNWIHEHCLIENSQLENCLVFPHTTIQNETYRNLIACGQERIQIDG